jgi:hypothetical protein
MHGWTTAAALIAALGVSSAAQAATYYTATGGNDTRSCTEAASASTPKHSISSGASCLHPGDVLIVADGVYDESLINNLPSGTSWSAPVKIQAAQGATVWIRPSSGDAAMWLNQTQQYIEFDGIRFDATHTTNGAIKVEGWQLGTGNPHHIRIKNSEVIGSKDVSAIAILWNALVPGIIGGNELINTVVHGGGKYDRDHGIYIQSSDNLIDGCTFYDLPGAGIQIYNGYGQPPNNNRIQNSTIRNLRSGVMGDDGSAGRHWGIVVYSTRAGTVIQNVSIHDIPNNGGSTSGIEVASATNVTMRYVTITRVQGTGFNVTNTGHVVENSIAYGNSTDYSGEATTSHNLFGTDPKFVNAAGGDLHLQSGSPAIDQAQAVAGVTTDLEGTARPQGSAPDIGAYEYASSAPQPPQPGPSPVYPSAPAAMTGLKVLQ